MIVPSAFPSSQVQYRQSEMTMKYSNFICLEYKSNPSFLNFLTRVLIELSEFGYLRNQRNERNQRIYLKIVIDINNKFILDS